MFEIDRAFVKNVHYMPAKYFKKSLRGLEAGGFCEWRSKETRQGWENSLADVIK